MDRNKSSLQISGKVAGCVVRTLKTFQCTHILGASRGLLCDGSAVLLLVGQLFLVVMMMTSEIRQAYYSDTGQCCTDAPYEVKNASKTRCAS